MYDKDQKEERDSEIEHCGADFNNTVCRIYNIKGGGVGGRGKGGDFTCFVEAEVAAQPVSLEWEVAFVAAGAGHYYQERYYL